MKRTPLNGLHPYFNRKSLPNPAEYFKSQGLVAKQDDIERASKLLAACGLKVVPVISPVLPEDEIVALRVLARRSDVLSADNINWDARF